MADGGASVVVAAVAAGIALLPVMRATGKDAKKWCHDKKEYSKSLTNNYDKLYEKLQELLGLVSDVKAHEENLRLRTAIKAWLSRALEIKVDVEGLVEEYDHQTLRAYAIRKRAKLSKEMEEKCMELHEHVDLGILLNIPSTRPKPSKTPQAI